MGRTNKVFFSGRIAKPELKYTNTGMAIFSCSLAINDSYKNKQTNEWVDKTIWMYIKAFDKKAANYSILEKGTEVLVEGRLKQDADYTAKDGTKRNGSHYIDPENISIINQIKAQSDSVTPEIMPDNQPSPFQNGDVPF